MNWDPLDLPTVAEVEAELKRKEAECKEFKVASEVAWARRTKTLGCWEALLKALKDGEEC